MTDGPLAFDGELLSAKIPALGVAQDQVSRTRDNLDGYLGGLGTLWPGGEDDDLTKTFATNYASYQGVIHDFMGLLSDAVGGQQGSVGTAGTAHYDAEASNVTTSKKW